MSSNYNTKPTILCFIQQQYQQNNNNNKDSEQANNYFESVKK